MSEPVGFANSEALSDMADRPSDMAMTLSQVALLDKHGLDRRTRQIMACSLSEDFHDTLMDDNYMAHMVVHVENDARQRRIMYARYVQLQNYIFLALLIQAVIGVLLALWMTVMQPQFTYATEVSLEDVDMVVMLDGSWHRGDDAARVLTHTSVSNFTNILFDAMESYSNQELLKAAAGIIRLRAEHQTWIQHIFNHYELTNQDQQKRMLKHVGRSRGFLRMATGLFNGALTPSGPAAQLDSGLKAIAPGLRHPLSYDRSQPIRAMESLKQGGRSYYQAHAQLYDAMQQCKNIFEDSATKGKELFPDPFDRRGVRCWQESRFPGEPKCRTFTSQSACPQRYCKWSSVPTNDAAVRQDKCRDKTPLCRRQFCVIIGDSDTMCKKQGQKSESGWSEKAKALCDRVRSQEGIAKKNPLCVSREALEVLGNPLEWREGMQDCNAYQATISQPPLFGFDRESLAWDVANMNKQLDMGLVLLFTVDSEAEQQMLLSNPTFRKFLQKSFGCEVRVRAAEKLLPDGTVNVYDQFYMDKNCSRFVMDVDFNRLLHRGKDMLVSMLTPPSIRVDVRPDSRMDLRYLFFLLLPANLVFYLGWTQVVRWLADMQRSVWRSMGIKKKMIKVTKTLVEKKDDRLGMPYTGMEIELAQVEKVKSQVEFGESLSLRARLKGGYIRAETEINLADCEGKAFDPNATWTFQPLDGKVGPLAHAKIDPGVPFRIYNRRGQLLQVSVQAATFVQEPDPGGKTEFTIEGHPMHYLPKELVNGPPGMADMMGLDVDEGGPAFMGDPALIKCLGTGFYLRVHKDGRVDGSGNRMHPETQIVVDGGGAPVVTGSIVTLSSEVAQAFLHASPDGAVRVGHHKDDKTDVFSSEYDPADWVYWLIDFAEPTVLVGKGSRGHVGALATIRERGEKEEREGFRRNGPTMKITDMGMARSFHAGEFGGPRFGLDRDSGFSESVELGMTPVRSAPEEIGRGPARIDPRQNKEILHVGDIVTLKAVNGHMLGIDERGGVECGLEELALQEGGSSSSSAPAPQSVVTQEFVISRTGMSYLTKHNNTIRRGERICLKPYMPGGGGRTNDYLKVNKRQSGLEAKGSVYEEEVGLMLDLATVQDLVVPISAAMDKGDVIVRVRSISGKAGVTEALAAAYCTEKDLARLRGKILVADGSTLSVIQGQGNWLPMVDDNVDLYKGAQLAKARGAVGLIIRCSDQLQVLERLTMGCSGSNKAPPALPIIFVDREGAAVLSERGLVLEGCEFRKKSVTDVTRAIARAPTAKGRLGIRDIFIAASRAMVERENELKAWDDREQDPEVQEEGTEVVQDAPHFKWQVRSSMGYLQSGMNARSSAIGMPQNRGNSSVPQGISRNSALSGPRASALGIPAARRSVNFSTSPTKSRSSKVGVRGSMMSARSSRRASAAKPSKRTRISVMAVDAADWKERRMAAEPSMDNRLSNFVAGQNGRGAEVMEDLPEDSDFKIEYEFKEVEVGIAEDPGDIEEEEYFNEEGAEVIQIGVPRKKFWIVCVGLVASTVFFFVILVISLNADDAALRMETIAEQKDIYPLAFPALNAEGEEADMPSLSRKVTDDFLHSRDAMGRAAGTASEGGPLFDWRSLPLARLWP